MMLCCGETDRSFAVIWRAPTLLTWNKTLLIEDICPPKSSRINTDDLCSVQRGSCSISELKHDWAIQYSPVTAILKPVVRHHFGFSFSISAILWKLMWSHLRLDMSPEGSAIIQSLVWSCLSMQCAMMDHDLRRWWTQTLTLNNNKWI